MDTRQIRNNAVRTKWAAPDIMVLTLSGSYGHVPTRSTVSEIRSIQTTARNEPAGAPAWVVIHVEGECNPHTVDDHIGEDNLLNSADMLLDNLDGWGADVMTIAAIEFEARDAALEVAASCDFVTCCASVQFGFSTMPSGRGSAFGGGILLARRIGDVGQRMASGGLDASALDMMSLGFVSRIASDGDGLGCALAFIKEHEAKSGGRSRYLEAKSCLARCNPIRPDNLYQATSQWLETVRAMRPRERLAYLG